MQGGMLARITSRIPGGVPLLVTRGIPARVRGEVPTRIPTGIRGEYPARYRGRIPGEMSSRMPSGIPGEMPSQMAGDMPQDMDGESRGGSTPLRPPDVECVTYAMSFGQVPNCLQMESLPVRLHGVVAGAACGWSMSQRSSSAMSRYVS